MIVLIRLKYLPSGFKFRVVDNFAVSKNVSRCRTSVIQVVGCLPWNVNVNFPLWSCFNSVELHAYSQGDQYLHYHERPTTTIKVEQRPVFVAKHIHFWQMQKG